MSTGFACFCAGILFIILCRGAGVEARRVLSNFLFENTVRSWM